MDVVADQNVSLHKVLLVLPVLSDHREGVVDGGAQDADQGLDPGVRVDVGQVGLHDVTGRQPGATRVRKDAAKSRQVLYDVHTHR